MMNVEATRRHLLAKVGNRARCNDRTVTTTDFGNGVILFECEDSSGFYPPMGLEEALFFLFHGTIQDYIFEAEYVNEETAETIERRVAVERDVCKNEGEAFMFASAELYRIASKDERMVSVERIK